ncbi:MAG: hypothetical protein WA064_03415 [Candidatus Moraniibacteriota bacterium]
MINNPIKITDYARMYVEDNNYTMEYRVKTGVTPGGGKAKNEWKWILGGYFPTIESAFRDFVENAPIYSPEELKSLRDLVECIKTAEERMTELLGKNR